MSAEPPGLLSPALLFTAIYFFLASAAGVVFALHERECSQLIEQLASRQDLNHVTEMDVNLQPHRMGFWTSLFVRMSNRRYADSSQARANRRAIADLNSRLDPEIAASRDAAAAVLGLTALFLAGTFLRPSRSPGFAALRICHLQAASLICFALGISCPVLTAAVKGRHALVGHFIIEASSKGIVSTVATLFRSGNHVLALLLAGFSIGIPLFKAGAILATLFHPSPGKRARIGRWLEALGKWSLTDVLVAAVLLGIFSLDAIQNSSGGIVAVPRFAFGFFVLYCVLAARASILLRRAAREPPPPRPALGRLAAGAALLILCLALGALAGRYGFGALAAAGSASMRDLVRP